MNLSSPLVSVIIPTRNSEKFIGKCFKSIKNQTYKNLEMVVVDQSSEDATVKIAKEFGAKVIILSKPKFYTPPTKSRNIGAKESKGEILYHLDSDMSLSPELTEEAVSLFKKNKHFGALIVHEKDVARGFWSRAKSLERRCYWGNQKIESARIVRKSLFAKVGGYDENISSGEDFDIHRRYQEFTKIGFCKNIVFHDLGKLNFFTLIKKKYYYGKTAGKYFKKHSESGSSLLKEQFRCFLNSYKLFIKAPLTGIGAIILKISEFGFGGVGYLIGKLSK